MTENNDTDSFPVAAAWDETDDEDEDEQSDFAERVEEIREQRDRNDDEGKDDTDESLDEAVERLSGRVYRVKYPDPADPESTEREKIVADEIQPTAAGMVFHRKGREQTHVYPAPVEFEQLGDDRVRSWAKSRRKLNSALKSIASIFGG